MKEFARAALIAAATLVTLPAQAATFAEFSGAAANWFSYTGTPGDGGTLSGDTTVNFAAFGLGFSDFIQDAKFTLTASSNTAPSTWANNMNATQVFQTGTLTFTAPASYAAAHGGLSNLLTVTFTNGALNVTPNGSTNVTFAVTDGEQQFNGSLSTISYSSDFFDFTDATDYDFAFSLTGASTQIVVQPQVGSYVNFTASGPGSFAAVTAVPEPEQWAMLLVGFGLVGGSMRRRRRMSMVTA